MKTIKLQVLASLLIVLVGTGCEFDLPEEGAVPDITFPEASFTADIGSNHRQIVFTNTTNDEATGFIWDFGDGNTAEVNLDNRDTTYQYGEDGTYEVTLTAFDNNEVTSTFSTTLNIFDETPPLANFDFAQLDGDFRVVTFSNLSQNADSAVWDFGDGSGISSEFNPVYTFAGANSGDEFDVTLRAIDELLDFADTTITITLVDDPTRPIANFSSETVGLTVFFTNESVNATSYVWDFGDGNTSTDLNPAHRYETAGRYEASLSAISDDMRVTTLTKAVVADQFVPIIANGTFDDYTGINNGDNIDMWDMTPNSTIASLDGGPDIPSPFIEQWNNTALNAFIDAKYCTNEQAANTSNGAFKTRGAKFDAPCRRLYQVVEVLADEEYSITLQTRSEAEGISTEVFILNTEITTEDEIDADPSTDNPLVDGYLLITNDFNSSSGSSENNTLTGSFLTFTASTDKIVIYIRSLDAENTMTEVFVDNITIN